MHYLYLFSTQFVLLNTLYFIPNLSLLFPLAVYIYLQHQSTGTCELLVNSVSKGIIFTDLPTNAASKLYFIGHVRSIYLFISLALIPPPSPLLALSGLWSLWCMPTDLYSRSCKSNRRGAGR
jgi:hypothetical protein